MPELYSQLWNLDLDGISQAAKNWHNLSAELESAHTQHHRQVTLPLKKAGWSGEAATSAFLFLNGVETRLEIGRVEAELISTVLSTVHQRMAKAKSDLRAVITEAEGYGYTVTGDGTVYPPPHTSRYEAEEGAGQLTAYRDRVESAIAAARQASDDGRSALTALHGDVMAQYRPHALNEASLDAQAALMYLGIDPPKPPKDPKSAAAWWKGLTAEQQRDYTLYYPQLIGNVDGLPSTVRDNANRLSLDEQLDDPELLTGHDYGVGTSAVIDPRYTAMMKLKDALDANDGAAPGKELYLLSVKGAGDGQVVIAQGNPDTATHTGVYVPGTSTTLSGVSGSLNRINLLQQAAEGAHPDGSVSTVFWLGYDAPELDQTVTTRTRAEAGAPDLQHFIAGTRAAQGPDHHHITVIGHSYGSTVVGTAANTGQLGADDIVAVGSPGMNGYAHDFGIPRDHVYVGKSDNDPIAHYLSGLSLGEDPASPKFGASQFQVAQGDHSSYFDRGSIGLENMGAIIAGKEPTLVHPAPVRDPMDPLHPMYPAVP
ncbi:alpha/beta hydrolase family protein [Streptomyces cocklensis]|uniref:DUF1023 domain-containing protein n=1 Tax=Actinacidiphila cocklensis TaxID=887465 RepID=A0A9W4DPX1_9ACTN|nr:alpha/beta hydrolase [Actinacidiphila cocklensis]MDD1062584.1 alpha/beta hydrolase family protein [Actinacidiphila cocklensis]WSX72407.1 alpha/beta hydrolase family protein [Streptomyces sp. NBC_00899]WSX81522.1 alpha/beta hydrolase family protein [Streptomyces sp. NBC_00899]CAG6391853.1 conserved hypothetical protein [Actinacidiphila cocklensis]